MMRPRARAAEVRVLQLLFLRNLVGQVAKRERIQAGVTQQAVNLDGLTEGIWLVSVVSEGRVLATQRLVIR